MVSHAVSARICCSLLMQCSSDQWATGSIARASSWRSAVIAIGRSRRRFQPKSKWLSLKAVNHSLTRDGWKAKGSNSEFEGASSWKFYWGVHPKPRHAKHGLLQGIILSGSDGSRARCCRVTGRSWRSPCSFWRQLGNHPKLGSGFF